MSLNGLDADAVTAAYAAAVAEPAGWFLLHYVSRDEVGLLKSGTDGFTEAREAMALYEEPSPLFGLVVHKKKKALLKYVPEDTSRLLQARVSVHLQSVIEKFPHEALLELATAAELTESALSNSLAQLKSSASSLRAPAPRQRPLTEIAEDSDETSQLHASAVDDLTGGPESPPDPLLSPASQPYLAARLEDAPESATRDIEARSNGRPGAEARSSDDRKQSGDSRLSADEAARAAGSLDLAALESDPLWPYKTKVKLGPRPSLDQDVIPRASGTFTRPVASLPAGVRIAPKSPRDFDRPPTHPSPSPSAEGDMPRHAMVSPNMRPSSRSGSSASIPTNASPLSPTSPGMTPEKQRLMKALQQRKKQQEAKRLAAEEAAKQAAEDAAAAEDAPVQLEEKELADQPQEVAEKTPTSPVPQEEISRPVDQPVIDRGLVADMHLSPTNDIGHAKPAPATENLVDSFPLPTGSEGASEGLQNHGVAILTDAVEPPAIDTPISTAKQPEEPKGAVEIQAPNGAEHTAQQAVQSVRSDGDTHVESTVPAEPILPVEESEQKPTSPTKADNNRIRQNIQEGIYLAHSASPSSMSEDSGNVPLFVAGQVPLSIDRDVAPQAEQPMPPTDLEDQPVTAMGLPIEGAQMQHRGDDSTFTSSAPESFPKEEQAKSLEPELQTNEQMETPVISQTPITDGLGIESFQNESFVPGSVPPQLSSQSGVPKLDSAIATSIPVADAQDHTATGVAVADATSSLPAASPIDTVVAAVRESAHHRPTESTSTVVAPTPTNAVAASSFSTTEPINDARNTIGSEFNGELLTIDPKRSSAASRASSTKRRPPPLSPSKHDSSDLASLDGDSLYEELRSATVEEARPMVVSRSPATPMFQGISRPGSRRGSDNMPPSRAANGSPASGSEGMRPKLVKTATPPSALSQFDSDVPHPEAPTTFAEPLELTKTRESETGSTRAPSNADTKSSPNRKGSGVSSLISQRIKAFESANTGRASPTDRAAMIAPSIVSQRKASLTTPPSSAGADSLNGARANRPYPTPSPSPQNPQIGFVARTFGSVRVSNNHVQHQSSRESLHRQPSRESNRTTEASRSTASSRLGSHGSSPGELQKPMASYFAVPAPPQPKTTRSYSTNTASSTGTEKNRGGSAAGSTDTRNSNRRRSTTSQQSSDTARPLSSGRSESSFSSEGGEKSEKRNSRGSRLLQRMSSAMSPRRTIAQALTSPAEPSRVEPVKAKPAAIARVPSPPKPQKQPQKQPTIGPRGWTAVEVGDVQIQFPDNLLWKRRHLEVDAAGNIMLLAPTQDKTGTRAVTTQQYPITMFRAPYIPDQDREEMPHSIILDFQDGSTLQCSCIDTQEQNKVLQILRNAHAAFASR